MIEVKNLSYFYEAENNIKENVLENISLKINDGEFVAVLGHNGSGKSTFAKHLNAILQPSDGCIWIDGVSTSDEEMLWHIRSKVGMVFQNPDNQIVASVVEEDVAFAPENLGVEPKEIRKRVDKALETVGLSAYAEHDTHKLSGGQKQRVAIARALANNTKILLCDEPTSALDAETTNSVLKLLREVNEKLGVTIVIITHELDVIKSICNRVAVMRNGEVVELGDVYEVFTNPKHEFTKELLSHGQNFKLPEEVVQNVKGDIYKLTYKGDGATESILSQVTAENKVQFNILHGKIEYISSRPLGILFVNFSGDENSVQTVLVELKKKIFKLEKYTR